LPVASHSTRSLAWSPAGVVASSFAQAGLVVVPQSIWSSAIEVSHGGGNVAPPLLDEDDEELLDDAGSPLLLDELELELPVGLLRTAASKWSSPVAPASGASSNEMRNVHPTTHVVKAPPRTSASAGRIP
jgi:hypothetical protein